MGIFANQSNGEYCLSGVILTCAKKQTETATKNDSRTAKRFFMVRYCLKSRDEKNFYPGMCRYPCSAAYKNWRWPDRGFRSSDLERNADMTHPLSSAWCGSYLIILENRSVENVRWLKNLRIEGFHVKNILTLMYCWFAIFGLGTLTCTHAATLELRRLTNIKPKIMLYLIC